MDFYQWFFDTLERQLEAFNVPSWVSRAMVSALEAAFPREAVASFELELKKKVADELKQLVTANPSSLLTAEIVAEAGKLLGLP